MDVNSLKYPIYIVTKGRWENPLTAKYFIRDGIPFKAVVEPQEYENYVAAIGESHVLKLPFANLGLGSFPARNFCWDHSVSLGFKKHFIFDDNIRGFYRFNEGKRINCHSLPALLALQEISERYYKLAISGYNYGYFVTRENRKAFAINTHVYSGMLINNEIPFRWRLKYNEDVDICLQTLHGGWNTILINVFLINKTSTVAKMKGGNQTELYLNNDEKKKMLKSRSLQRIWPQYVEVGWKYGRPHHFVNWKKFFHHPLRKFK